MKLPNLLKLALALGMATGVNLATAATPVYTMKVAAPGIKDGTTEPVQTSTLVSKGAGRTWSDGSTARSCKEYLIGDATHRYEGATGSGTYTISPLGSALDTYCDMATDGGGWTLTAYNRGVSGLSQMTPQFFVSSMNPASIANRSAPNLAASINTEAVSKALKTQDVMLVAPAYSASPIIEKNNGPWDYDKPDCTAPLGHTSRTAGCNNHSSNDEPYGADMLNIAIYGGTTAIAPSYANMGYELCYYQRGWCSFEFYVR